jgi:hypothetical protein
MRANPRFSFLGFDRSLRLALCSVAMLAAFNVAARAADDDEEDTQSFGQKIIGTVIRGIGGSSLDGTACFPDSGARSSTFGGITSGERSRYSMLLPSRLEPPMPRMTVPMIF